jgi:hypothetical protein
VAQGGLAAVGLCLYLGGWWTHRFWTALVATFAAGLAGLVLAKDLGVPPLVAGLLLAVAAGSLALALTRITLFGVYGVGLWLAVQGLAPKAAIPVVWICAGGLLATVFHRYAVTLLTSALGLWLLAHGGLLLAEKFAALDAVAWTTKQGSWVTVGYAALVFAGVVWQYWADRAYRAYLQRQKEWREWVARQQAPKPPPQPREKEPARKPAGLFGRFRKAA